MAETLSKPAAAALGPAVSLGAGGLLWIALQRAFRGGGGSPDALLLDAARSFRAGEWLLLVVVVVACALAIVKRRRGLLLHVQAWSLAGGLILTHFSLGAEVGKKMDPRFAFALISGIASLHCCYACLVAYAIIALAPRQSSA